jgi:hypothetical protein
MTKNEMTYCPHGYLMQALPGLPLATICDTCAEQSLPRGPALLALCALNEELAAKQPQAQTVPGNERSLAIP